MAVDPRLECLPEHEGPAFKSWQIIMQTAMDKCTQSSPPSDSVSYSDANYKRKPMASAEEFIPLKDIEDKTKDIENIATESDNDKQKKRKKSVCSNSSTEDNEENKSKVGIVPWKSCDKYPANAYGLHMEIIDFYHHISPLPEEEAMRHDVVRRITLLITSMWPAAKVEVFGSFRTSLYLPSSDIDLVVFGKWDKLPLFTLQKALITNDLADAASIKVLDKASVPIIKLREKHSKVRVDISFNTEASVKSVTMVKYYIQKFQIMPFLFLTLKHFLVQRDLNEVFTGGISSYCLMLLIVSFLQRHPRVKEHNLNLGVLFMEFLELYGRNFNYQRIGIKIKNGGCYVNKDELTSDLGNGEYPALLCIEDPVTLASDIGRSSYGILRVKEAFEYAFNVIDSALRNKHYFKVNPTSTYLSRVISISQDLHDYRIWVQKTYNPMLTISRPMLAHSVYQGIMTPYKSSDRPALLPTPSSSNMYAPRMIPTPQFSPFTTNANTVTFNPFGFFGNTGPQQQLLLSNIATNVPTTMQSNKENRISSLHMHQQNQNVLQSIPHIAPIEYISPRLLKLNSSQAEQVVHKQLSTPLGSSRSNSVSDIGIPVTFHNDKSNTSYDHPVHVHTKQTSKQAVLKQREYFDTRCNDGSRISSRKNCNIDARNLSSTEPIYGEMKYIGNPNVFHKDNITSKDYTGGSKFTKTTVISDKDKINVEISDTKDQECMDVEDPVISELIDVTDESDSVIFLDEVIVNEENNPEIIAVESSSDSCGNEE